MTFVLWLSFFMHSWTFPMTLILTYILAIIPNLQEPRLVWAVHSRIKTAND